MKYNQPLKDPNTKAQEQEKPFLTVIAKVTPQDAEKCLAMLQGKVLSPQRIGTVRPYAGGKRIFLK